MIKQHKTTVSKPSLVDRKWYEIDAKGIPMGRVAVKAAKLLIGKQKPSYTPHVDGGDYVIIVNAKEAVLTGRKSAEEVHSYSGYPGGLKSTTKQKLMKSNPAKLVEKAIYGMLPTNKLRPGRMQRLKIYNDETHNHGPQKPQKLEIK